MAHPSLTLRTGPLGLRPEPQEGLGHAASVPLRERLDHDFMQMIENDDGWCDWVHPLPGYLPACCDCGLVHEMEFAIIKPDQPTPLNDGENGRRIIVFRARRASPRHAKPDWRKWWQKLIYSKDGPTQADYHAGVA